MKKVLAIAFIAGVAFTACKKEYECCYYDSNGDKISDSGYGCTTQKMTKSEKDDLESDMKSSAEPLGWDAKCE